MASEEESNPKMDVEEVNNKEESTEKKSDEIQSEASKSSKEEDKKDAKLKQGMTAGAAAAANPHYRVKISGLPRFYTPTVSIHCIVYLNINKHINLNNVRSKDLN